MGATKQDGVGSYTGEWWNLLEWLFIGFNVGFLVTRILWWQGYPDIDPLSPLYVNWEGKFALYTLNMQLLALAGFGQVMKALKFMGLYSRFGVITKTILVSIPGATSHFDAILTRI
jgi:hypothetical protein